MKWVAVPFCHHFRILVSLLREARPGHEAILDPELVNSKVSPDILSLATELPGFLVIPLALDHISTESLANRPYRNTSIWIGKHSLMPSTALKLLPELDSLMGTSLAPHYDAFISQVAPFHSWDCLRNFVDMCMNTPALVLVGSLLVIRRVNPQKTRILNAIWASSLFLASFTMKSLSISTEVRYCTCALIISTWARKASWNLCSPSMTLLLRWIRAFFPISIN